MMLQLLQNHYIWLLLSTAGLYMVLSFAAWQRRAAIGAIWFALFLLFSAIWPLGYAFEVGSSTLSVKIFWIQVQYIGIVGMPPLWLAFALHYVGKEQWLTRQTTAILAIGSFVTLFLAYTNEFHHWMWTSFELIESTEPLIRTPGFYYWLHIVSSYSVIFSAFILLIRQFIGSPYLYRKQIFALLVGGMIPWCVNLLRVFQSELLASIPLDLTPLVLALSSLPFTWSLFQFRFLDILPRAHNAIFQSIADGVLVIDTTQRIVHINPAAQAIFAEIVPDAVGQPVSKLLGVKPEDLPPLPQEKRESRELILASSQGERAFEVRLLPLTMHNQRLNGQLVVLHDITARKGAEAERDQSIKQLTENLFRTQTLYRATRAMISTEGLPLVLQAVVDGIASALKAYRVTLVTIDFDKHKIINFVKAGPGANMIKEPTYADLAKGVTGWVVREKRLAQITKHPANKHDRIKVDQRHGETYNGAMIVAPIIYRGEVLGAMSVVNRPDDPDFTNRDNQLLLAMASQAAIGLTNARLFYEIQQMAMIDELTGLYNRRHFFKLAEEKVAQMIQQDEPLSAIMFDIDYFKTFNDNYGHAIGDEVLRRVANVALQHLRDSDVIGRYGGEEFAIILPQTRLSIAHRVAERLRSRIESSLVDTIHGQLSVTISLGVAHINPTILTLADLLNEADKALYKAKEAGRNRVEVAEEVPVPA